MLTAVQTRKLNTYSLANIWCHVLLYNLLNFLQYFLINIGNFSHLKVRFEETSYEVMVLY
jgi:hypothetical protein